MNRIFKVTKLMPAGVKKKVNIMEAVMRPGIWGIQLLIHKDETSYKHAEVYILISLGREAHKTRRK